MTFVTHTPLSAHKRRKEEGHMRRPKMSDIMSEYESATEPDTEPTEAQLIERAEAAREAKRQELILQISAARTGKQLYPYPRNLREQKRYNALCKEYESIFGRRSLQNAEFSPGISWLQGRRKAA